MSDFTTEARVYTISGGQPFLDALADGLWTQADRDPLALSRMTVLLPTRRSVIALRDAFLRLGQGRAMLLPTIRPVGDADEDQADFADPASLGLAAPQDLPPAIPALQRQLALTRLVQSFAQRTGGDGESARRQLDQAALLAAELARLLDQIQIEGLSFDALAGLVPRDLAHHWQETLEFLGIVTEAWPAYLRELGAMDPTERRIKLAEAQAELWRAIPPTDPIVIAGSTGSVPATSALMEIICRLPQGSVVLPGLDPTVDDESWGEILRDAGHPQHGMARLLGLLRVDRAEVRPWLSNVPEQALTARAELLAEAMRPAATTEAWRELQSRGSGLPADAIRGLSRIDAPTARDEAAVIALMMRGALEEPGRTSALVTPDRALARRVKAELRRWDLEVDDSAGIPLAETETMAFWQLVAQMAASDLAPIPLLAALKHPLAAGGLTPGGFRRRVRQLEQAVLRGPRPGPGPDGLRQALTQVPAELEPEGLIAWLAGFEDEVRALIAALRDPVIELARLLEIHAALAEALAASDQQVGAARLWAGEAGEDAANFLAELRAAADTLPPIEGYAYPGLMDALLSGQVHRPRHGTHPRLAILGPLEARLTKSDLMILGGLNEGTWPPDPGADPWMSRPMRAAFGLPPPERRIGLSAHDFVSACAAGQVVLTRAERVDGSPTVASRWLLRLETVLRAVGLDQAPILAGAGWLDQHRQLDAPRHIQAIAPPAPRPPVSARPRQFSVTQIETWIRDPYAIHARRILKLRALEPIDANPGAADRGRFIHAALDRFTKQFAAAPPPDGLDRLLGFGREAFGETLAHPTVWAFWWPRFERIAAWFIEHESTRTDRPDLIASECHGKITLAGPAGPVVLSAIADRIERAPKDADQGGAYTVIDYKTGLAPTRADVALGVAPQLPLEALILRAGGFDDLSPGTIAALSYWRLSGGDPPANITSLEKDLEERLDEAAEGLALLIATFDDPETPYLSVPDPALAPRWSDYAHLARIREWSVEGG